MAEPLQPSGTAGAEAVAALQQVTGRLDAGEERPQQVAMARAVAGAIDSGRHLVVQAGTGTGKSLGYLVPAVLSGRRVVVATATKALQDQLFEHDLPLVTGALGTGSTFAVLKGRSNYLCRQRAAEVDGRAIQEELPVAGEVAPADGTGDGAGDGAGSGAGDGAGSGAGDGTGDGLVDHVRRLLDWSRRSPTGDRAELDFEPHPRAWAMLSVGPRECPGAFRCPSGATCFAERARTAAAAADVVVVNTHLYGAHLASGGAVLPPHDVVIFDEAHEIEEIMTASLGAEVTPGRIRALQAAARPLLGDREGGDAVAALGQVADRLQNILAGAVGTRVLAGPVGRGGEGRHREAHEGVDGDGPGGRQRDRVIARPSAHRGAAAVEGGGPEAGNRPDADLAACLELAAARVAALTALLRGAGGTDQGGAGAGDRSGAGVPDLSDAGGDRVARVARALSAAGHVAGDLDRLAAAATGEVAWVDGTPSAPVLRLSPINVGPPLADLLWEGPTAVLTSATIPPRLGDRIGLSAFPLETLDVGTPFDYHSHALLYVARHLPDRRQPESEPALHQELAELIGAAGGRTLALFTSHRATQRAAEAVRAQVPYPVLVQGDRPKGRLLAAFAREEAACLFATLGFWQGVDVPGQSLLLVTIDRLPFPRPDDPLTQARREAAGDAWFRAVDLPRAATLLAQGAGRLIRTATDRGVVAVLDPRLATAGYRNVLLSAVPPMRRTTDGRLARRFLSDATSS